MRDALRVRGVQRGEDLQAYLGRLRGGERPLLPQDVTQRLIRQKLHDDPRVIVFLDDVVDEDHVAVIQPCGDLRFPDGATAGCLTLAVGEAGRPDDLFHRHVTVEELVAGPPHDAHPAVPDDLAEPVAPI